jgi:hypothetical protein
MSSSQIPEAAGPGSADESGLVTYCQQPSSTATATRLPDAPPESLGPATETAGGGYVYGVPSSIQVVHPDLPTAAEREAAAADAARVMDSCACSVIPAGVIRQLWALAIRAVVTGTGGCPQCRAIPRILVAQLSAALDRDLEGASR